MSPLTRLDPWLSTGAAAWLVSREVHPRVAREAWAKGLPATLRSGAHFDAVHIVASLIEHRAASRERDAVEAHFRAAGITGAVIVSRRHDRYTTLVPPGTSDFWDFPHTQCLGRDYVTTPVPTRREPPGAYWLLPAPDGELALCPPARLRALLCTTTER
ncbi:hypothetical protein [Streptomyces sp. I05A-00742]|uniref:hypothetical protein n=1 Tax=Streptomyces sp. I05A-00742 TaxID=2732853 RepID=UPI001488CD0F|nr:hypothetical protein [Streptomyces sp. I05A-00742]